MIRNDDFQMTASTLEKIKQRLEASAQLAEIQGEVILRGPFAAYVASPKVLLEFGFKKSLKPVGYRLLVINSQKPVCVIDIIDNDGQHEVGAIRFGEAAKAFQAVLALAQKSINNGSARWVSMPAINTTFLWIAGRGYHFIATRIDARRVEKPEVVNLGDLRRLVMFIRGSRRRQPGFEALQGVRTTKFALPDADDDSNGFVW